MALDLREKLNATRLPHNTAIRAEVARRLEAPVEGTDHPVLEALDVLGDVAVDGATLVEGWKACLGVEEAAHGLGAHVADEVDGLLERETHRLHGDDDHVVRVSA